MRDPECKLWDLPDERLAKLVDKSRAVGIDLRDTLLTGLLASGKTDVLAQRARRDRILLQAEL